MNFDGIQVPFPVALEVNVVLIGFMNDGGYRFHLDHDKLHQHMKSSFPTHRPSCMETGEMLDIEFDISYNIVPVSSADNLGINLVFVKPNVLNVLNNS